MQLFLLHSKKCFFKKLDDCSAWELGMLAVCPWQPEPPFVLLRFSKSFKVMGKYIKYKLEVAQLKIKF